MLSTIPWLVGLNDMVEKIIFISYKSYCDMIHYW